MTHSVETADVAAVGLFADLPEDELASLAADTARIRLGDGKVLVAQGAPSATLYHVVSGSLVLRAADRGRSVIVDTLGPGDLLGWSVLRPNATALTEARASGPVELLAIPAEPVLALAAGGSRAARQLVEGLISLAASHLEASRAQLLQAGHEGVITGG